MDQKEAHRGLGDESPLSQSEPTFRDSSQNSAFVRLAVFMCVRVFQGSLKKPGRCPVLNPNWPGGDLPRRAHTHSVQGGSGAQLGWQ